MSAAHKVLTQRELFTLILTYFSGLPFWLRDAIKASLGTRHDGITRSRVHLWMQEKVLKRGDIAGLRRLLRLQQHNQWYVDPPLVILNGIVWRVVAYGQLALADWILDHCHKEGLVTKEDPIDTDPRRMLFAAVESGQIGSVEWVVARFPALLSGPPVPYVVMRSAVYSGAIPVLQWLLRHSLHCVDSSLVEDAVHNGYTDVLRWLLDSGYRPCALEHAL